MATLPGLAANLSLENQGFIRGLQRSASEMQRSARGIQRQQDQLSRGFAGIERSMSGMIGTARQMMGVFGVGLGVAGLGRLVSGAIQAGAAIGDLSDRLGVSSTALQSWRRAASVSGSSAQALDTALEQLARRAGEAATGIGGEAAKAFETLGVAVTDAGGRTRSTEAVFRDIAEAISRIESPAERAALAARLMGRSAGELTTLLGRGAAGLREFEDSLVSAGKVLGEDAVRDAQRLNDQWQELSDTLTTRLQSAVLTVAGSPGWGRLIELASEARDRLRELGDALGTTSIIPRAAENLEALRRGHMPGTPGAEAVGLLGRAGPIELPPPPLEVDIAGSRQGVTGGLTLAHEAIQQQLQALNAARENAVRTAEQQAAAEAALAAQLQGTVAELDREVSGLLAMSVAAGDSAEAVREVEIALLAEAAAIQAGAIAGTAEFARIAEQVTARERLRDSVAETISVREAEARRIESVTRAHEFSAQRIATELRGLAGGPMLELIDRIEDIDDAARTLPDAFEHEALVEGFLEAGENAVRLGEDIEEVALQLRLMGAAGAEAAERMELGVMAREWQSLATVAENSMATMLGNTARDFSTWRDNLKRGLTEVGNQFGQLAGVALGGGPLGNIGGAVIGGLAANLIGSVGKVFGGLFGGGGKPDRERLKVGGGDTFGLSALTGTVGIGGSADGGIQRQMAAAIGQFDQQMAAVLSGRQALLASQALEGANTSLRFRKFQIDREGADILVKRAREIMRALIPDIDVSRAMAGVGRRDVQGAQQRVAAVAQLSEFIRPSSAAAEAVSGLIHQFRTMTALARELGVSVGRVTAAYRTQAATLREQLLRPLEDQLRQQGDRVRSFFAGLLDPIEDMLGQMTTGPLAAASPQQQFLEAQAEFQRLAGRAQAGDLDAISRIADAGQVFLQQAQAFGASGPIFSDAFREVNSVLTGLQDELRRQREDATAGLPTVGEEMMNDTLKNILKENRRLLTEMAEVRRELQRFGAVRAA